MILGADGYLGTATTKYLRERGHEVMEIDNLSKRGMVSSECGEPLWEREDFAGIGMDVRDYSIRDVIKSFKPDAIVDYAEIPSAPYSMRTVAAANETFNNNVNGTLNLLWAIRDEAPDCHFVKLGTMGEYGTPNIDIEEGWLHVEHNGRKDRVMYPKSPGSFYHASKVADSVAIEFACRAWGIRATDLNQGVVYGLSDVFYYDETWGTVLNRFVVQAVAGMPLTVYGKGTQARTFLNIKDTCRCVELACENPADPGEFKVFNQFTEHFSVMDLAKKVSGVTGADIRHFENPRTEQEDHYYKASNKGFMDVGLEPHLLDDSVIGEMVSRVEECKRKINKDVINPKTAWKGIAASS